MVLGWQEIVGHEEGLSGAEKPTVGSGGGMILLREQIGSAFLT
jgi:hypothetical protein